MSNLGVIILPSYILESFLAHTHKNTTNLLYDFKVGFIVNYIHKCKMQSCKWPDTVWPAASLAETFVEQSPLPSLPFCTINAGCVLLSLLSRLTAAVPFLTVFSCPVASANVTSSLGWRVAVVAVRSPVSSRMVCMSPLVRCSGMAGGLLSLSSVESRESRRETDSQQTTTIIATIVHTTTTQSHSN